MQSNYAATLSLLEIGIFAKYYYSYLPNNVLVGYYEMPCDLLPSVVNSSNDEPAGGEPRKVADISKHYDEDDKDFAVCGSYR